VTITAGIYDDMPIEIYHSDPAPEPSLSQSGIRTLLTATPAHFKAKHPRLTDFPDEIDRPTKAQDFGTIIHSMVLGRGTEMAVIPFDNYKKKAAQDARDEARAAGRVPVLEKELPRLYAVAAFALDAIRRRYPDWSEGTAERALFWQLELNDGTSIWCRGLGDYSIGSARWFDLKTTDTGISDQELAKKIGNDGWDLQKAWTIQGVEALEPDFAGLVSFQDIVVEISPPYSVRFPPISERWLNSYTRPRISIATHMFGQCLQTRQWPSWTEDVANLEPPAWMAQAWEYQILAAMSREEHGGE
jgi:hypothetical protein